MRTYKAAHPRVNVMQIGIVRFLATSRRLVRLKGYQLKGAPSNGRPSLDGPGCSPTF